MSDSKPTVNPRYIIISPVRDEARFLERMVESVIQQTILPDRWLIVDDGSTDGTAEILQRYRVKNPWISVLERARNGGRQLGTAEIAAFNVAYETLGDTPYDFIVKLDCDLVLPAGYFEDLFEQFRCEPRLGIASGAYMEESSGRWNLISMPAYHAAGASKVIRRECFRAIGGFVCMRGWDTVDEIKAQALHWNTRHFQGIRFQHLKPEGSGSGWRSTQLLHGEVYYRSGGSKLLFMLKVLQRAVTTRPWIIGSAAMLWGYLRLALAREPRLVTTAEGRLYRQMQYSRILRGDRASAKAS